MKRILILGAFGAMSHVLMNEMAEGGEGAAAAPARTTAQIRPDTTGYQTAKSASGSSTKICGDEVSLALVGATLGETYSFVAGVVGISVEDLQAKYGARNPGQQRMFLGNLIRGAFAGKDQEKAARVRAAFEEETPAFRVAIDARLKTAAEELTKTREAAKAKREQDAAAAKQKKLDEKVAAKKLADEKKAANAEAKKGDAKANELAKADAKADPAGDVDADEE